MEFLSIFTILYQNGDIIKSWKHAPIMDFACIKTWKPMPNAKLRLPRSSIITPIKRIQLCYMMLIIGENTLVLRLLKVIIVLNSTATSKKSLSGRKILREYRGVKVSA